MGREQERGKEEEDKRVEEADGRRRKRKSGGEGCPALRSISQSDRSRTLRQNGCRTLRTGGHMPSQQECRDQTLWTKEEEKAQYTPRNICKSGTYSYTVL